MEMKLNPRIQGKVGIINEGPPEIIGKYAFEIWVSFIGAPQYAPQSMGVFAPYDSIEAAKVALEQAVTRAGKAVQEYIDGAERKDFFDMKSGKIRPWADIGKPRVVKD